VIEQKQARNERLTEEEEAIAEPFPLIPKTSFSCEGKPILPGLYADQETGCRVYHYCPPTAPVAAPAKIVQQIEQQQQELDVGPAQLNQEAFAQQLQQPQPEVETLKSFFCGEGTLFSQQLLTCDHAANVVCAHSARYYQTNEEFGKYCLISSDCVSLFKSVHRVIANTSKKGNRRRFDRSEVMLNKNLNQ
jgi:hypothetical protein